jgi:hypothetical protein
MESFDRRAITGRFSGKAGRSRITNGSELLPGIDGRSRWVLRSKDVLAAHLADLGGDNISAAERSIIRRAAVLNTKLERFDKPICRRTA